MDTNEIQVDNCKTNCKQTGYRVTHLQRKLLLKIYQLEQENGFAIRKDFDELSQRKFYYNVGKLTENDYIKSLAKNSKQLRTTDKGEQYLQSVFGDLQNNMEYVTPFMDRAHKITLTQPIIQRGDVPNGFIVSKKSHKLKWKVPQLTKKDKENKLSIRITPGTIVYSFSECYSVDPHHSTSTRMNVIFQYSRMFEQYGWKVDLPNIAVISQHHAIYNKELAKLTRRFKIYYKSDRITFDSSISCKEFELTHPEYAADDFCRLAEFWEAITRNELKLPVLLEMQEKHIQSNKNNNDK